MFDDVISALDTLQRISLFVVFVTFDIAIRCVCRLVGRGILLWSGNLGKVRKTVVCLPVLPQLRWSQNKHNLSTAKYN